MNGPTTSQLLRIGGGAALWTPAVLGTGLIVGVLSSVLPYTLDLVALGRVSPALFSIVKNSCAVSWCKGADVR